MLNRVRKIVWIVKIHIGAFLRRVKDNESLVIGVRNVHCSGNVFYQNQIRT